MTRTMEYHCQHVQLQSVKNACLIREQVKRTPYASTQALHGVAFHSEEDVAMYPQSPANSVAPASNDLICYSIKWH